MADRRGWRRRLGLGEPPLCLMEGSQVVEADGDVEMTPRQSLLSQFQRSLEKGLCLSQTALQVI
jgi:hypothetical protein